MEGFQQHLRKLNSLATHFENLVKSDTSKGYRLFVDRRFSLVVIQLLVLPSARDPINSLTDRVDTLNLAGPSQDVLNRAFFKLVSERDDIHLTPTVVGGEYCTRIAIGSPNTEIRHVEKCWELIKELSEVAREQLRVRN